MPFNLFRQSRRIAGSDIAVLSLCFVCSVLLPAHTLAYLQNGAAAIDALGQYDDSLSNPQPVYTKGTANNGPNILGFNGAFGATVDAVHHRLFVTDESNNRVLVYILNTDDSINSHIPTYVLGQPSFYTRAAATTQVGMSLPTVMAYDSAGNRLFVADYFNNRVLVFDASTITNGMNASYVLGQTSFTSSSAVTTQSGMSHPISLSYDSATNHLFVLENTNNRVLVFSGASLSNGMNANTVIGQANFTTASAATTQSGLSHPYGLTYDTGTTHLFVADYSNHRVLVFSGASLSNGMNANTVIGQANFTSAVAATTQAGMSTPIGVAYDGTRNRLFVASDLSNRVMVYSGASLSTGMSGSYVLGQSSFTTSATATTQSGINAPTSISFDGAGNRLYLAENGNSRITIFNTTNITNGMNASDELGQTDDSLTNPQPVYTKSAANNGPNKLGMLNPFGLTIDAVHHRLFIVEKSNNRVLEYDLDSSNHLLDHIPDHVLGQPNFYTNTAATTQAGMNVPVSVDYDAINNRLFVGEYTNSRVLVYNLAPGISDGMNATSVLGQSSFTGSTLATTQQGLHFVYRVKFDPNNNRLFVADNSNNRILIYDTSSIANGMNASYVLGQSSFTGSTVALSQSGLNAPSGFAYDSVRGRLFVADNGNSRLLIYNIGSGITNGMNASNVLGETGFIERVVGTTQARFNAIQDVAFDPTSNRVFVPDYTNNRVLVFNLAAGIINGMNASYVLGQNTFVTATFAATQSGLNGPADTYFDGTTNYLYVPEQTNNRVTVFDVTPSTQTTLTSSKSTSNLGDSVTFSICQFRSGRAQLFRASGYHLGGCGANHLSALRGRGESV